ncbi:MAG: recombinase family protein, partial [Actinobacteria bacterium]|nr:recombinase family protein [Actinomycetota bacterium]
RMRDGIRTKAETGRKATGSYPFGYTATGRGRERDAGPREDEQRTVRRIVDLRRAGQTYRAIAASLDSEGLRPRRAASWSAAAVRNIALRERPT